MNRVRYVLQDGHTITLAQKVYVPLYYKDHGLEQRIKTDNALEKSRVQQAKRADGLCKVLWRNSTSEITV